MNFTSYFIILFFVLSSLLNGSMMLSHNIRRVQRLPGFGGVGLRGIRKNTQHHFTRMSASRVVANKESALFTDGASFTSLGLHEELCSSLNACGIKQATSIQTKTYPAILNGSDVVIGAETGSGKTLSFLLPLFQAVLNSTNEQRTERNYPSAVIIAPNKELSKQVVEMATNVLSKSQYLKESITVGQ